GAEVVRHGEALQPENVLAELSEVVERGASHSSDADDDRVEAFSPHGPSVDGEAEFEVDVSIYRRCARARTSFTYIWVTGRMPCAWTERSPCAYAASAWVRSMPCSRNR